MTRHLSPLRRRQILACCAALMLQCCFVMEYAPDMPAARELFSAVLTTAGSWLLTAALLRR
ncbi:hypothetical protein ACH50_13675 [Franconibacter pulveris]|uniref:Uncharacterized protein n=1 Tax=Franconibacter pulveris TaxID=435910 RepID=A0A0J8VNJ2_9ENTR|nr:hypothetical protein ACH50_13675 [Franconibacter pulveris]